MSNLVDYLIILVPAILYFVGLFLWQRFKARRSKDSGAAVQAPAEEKPVDSVPPQEGRSRTKTRRGTYRDAFSEDSYEEDKEVAEAIRAADEVRLEQAEDLGSRLTKTRSGLLQKLKGIFSSKPKLEDDMLEELESVLVACDLGISTAEALLDGVEDELDAGQQIDEKTLIEILKRKILGILKKDSARGGEIVPQRKEDGPYVIMMVGVNGVGKTTTAAKLAQLFKDGGLNVMMAAGDTFRAAAVEQLTEWGNRIGVPVVAGLPNAKPATVVFDAMVEAKKNCMDVLLIDTAGRLQNKSNLMEELEGILNTIRRHQASAPHEVILVVDGATGQNALSQAREFNNSVPLSGLIVTKLDGTPKGGVVVAVKEELSIPIRYIGVGESTRDLRPFDPLEFVHALFDQPSPPGSPSAHGESRRRKREDSAGA